MLVAETQHTSRVVAVNLMRSVCTFVWFCVHMGASDEVTIPVQNLPQPHCCLLGETSVVLAASCSVLCVCVSVCSALVCSTCVWHYCDKAAQPLWGDGECQRLEPRSKQLPNIWWNEKHTGWMAGLLTPQRGSRAEGGGQVKPQMCVWNITLSLRSLFSPLLAHTSTRILKIKNTVCRHSHHFFVASNNTVFNESIIRRLFSRFSMPCRQNAQITSYVTFKGENSPFMADHFGKWFVESTLHLTKVHQRIQH